MKLLILIGILSLGSLGTEKPKPPQDEKTCKAACNTLWTKPWRDCHSVRVCEFYVEHQAKRCILKCEGQSGE